MKNNKIAPTHSRCAHSLREGRQIGTSIYTHLCKLEVAHTGKHLCICDKNWERKVNA